MQSTWDQINWYRADQSMQKQLLAFVLSVIMVVLILLIPVRLNQQFLEYESTMMVELDKTKLAIDSNEIIEPAKPEPKPLEPLEQVPVETLQQIKNVEPTQSLKPKEVVHEPMKQIPKEIISQPEQQLPSSVVFFESLNNGKPKLNSISKEFQVRTKDPYDYIYQTVEAPAWNHVTKLIDEDLDKPQTEMNFYPLGFDGAVERFMDKITYKKTFTTRYGTKIGCAITIIIAGCGWK
jgi:hypothetical protein